jgi:hypothetical protein
LDAFNEADGLVSALEGFRSRTGAYPKRTLVDKTCRNRKNHAWCKERGIAVSGPRLKRPLLGEERVVRSLVQQRALNRAQVLCP